jgi:hypothetical protein
LSIKIRKKNEIEKGESQILWVCRVMGNKEYLNFDLRLAFFFYINGMEYYTFSDTFQLSINETTKQEN